MYVGKNTLREESVFLTALLTKTRGSERILLIKKALLFDDYIPGKPPMPPGKPPIPPILPMRFIFFDAPGPENCLTI